MRAGHGPHTRLDQRGNVFAMLFGAVALTGVLAAVGMQTLTGPVTTITRVTQRNVAETNLLMSAKIIVNAAIAGTSGGDADGDGIIEPAPFVAAGGSDVPANGGFLPTDLGLNLTDPWGTRFGYCVWDHGTTNASANRITGDNTASAPTQTVIAIVTAGPDKVFQTTCSAYAGGSVDATKAAGSDDIIFKFTYAEATASSNGLWTLNTSDDAKAELKASAGSSVNVTIDRDTGIGDFLGVKTSTLAARTDVIAMDGGLQLDNETSVTACAAAGDAGVVRYNSVDGKMEVCDGSAWVPAGAAEPAGSAGEIQFNDGAGGLGADSNLFWDNSNKRLGVGTNTPAYTLDANGGINSGTGIYDFRGVHRLNGADVNLHIINGSTGSLNLATGGAPRLTITSAGNVGIGTTNPSAKLQVNGSMLLQYDGAVIAFRKSDGSGTPSLDLSGSGTLLHLAGSGLIPRTDDTGAIGTTGYRFNSVNAGTGTSTFGGRVGIGTTSPTEILSVGPDTDITAIVGRAKIGKVANVGSTDWASFGHYDRWTAGGASLAQSAAGQTILNAYTGQSINFRIGNGDKMFLSPTGSFGIGTTAPTSKLDVAGGVKIGADAACNASKAGMIAWNSNQMQLCTAVGSWVNLNAIDKLDDIGDVDAPAPTDNQVIAWDDASGTWKPKSIGGLGQAQATPGGADKQVQFNDGGTLAGASQLYWDKTTNRLGIGTASPATSLDISSSIPIIRLDHSGTYGAFRFYGSGTGMAAIAEGAGDLVIETGGVGSINEKVRIKSSGNVGIGTTTPRTTLEVNGRAMIEAPSNFWAATNFYGIGGTDRLGQLDTHGAYEVTLTSNGYRTSSGTWESYGANSQSGAAMVALNPAGYIDLRADASKASGSGTGITTRMRITSSGRVGIGTTSPASALHVSGDFWKGSSTTDGTASYARWTVADFILFNKDRCKSDGVGGTDPGGYCEGGGRALVHNAGDVLHINYNGDFDGGLYLDGPKTIISGNVGIGTTNPQTRLDVNGSLRIGNDAASCTASKEGAIKYVSGASPPYKYCDGTSWTDFSQVGGGAGDTAPNSFVFTDLTGQTFSALISSNTITLAGLDNPPELGVYTSISGQGSPQFRINGGTWVTSGYVNDGDTVQLRLTTSGSSLTTHSAVLTVGTASDTWSVTTTNQDNTPNAFAFTDLTGQGLAATISSNTLTINGIGPAPVSVSVSGAGSPQISINGGSWGTTGSISNGQTLRVRLTSANTSSTARSATITVGTVSDSWSVTTATVTAGSQTFSSAGTFTFTVPHHQTLTVKVWGGGGGGAGCTSVNEVAGGNGGNSSWASSVYGNGGKKASASAGGAGGTASGGTTNQTGGTGGTSGSNGAKGGNGASGGAGGAQRTSNGNGHNGSVPGGGGGGARLVARGSCNGDGGGGGGYATRTYAAGTYTQGTSVTVVVGASGSRGNGSSYKGGTGGVGRVTVSWN